MTVTADVPVGSRAFVAFYGSAASLGNPTCADSGGNTYVRAGTIYTTPNQLSIFSAPIRTALASGAGTITGSLTQPSTNKGICAFYVGGYVSSAVESFQTGTTASATSLTTAGINPTTPYTLAVGAHWHANVNATTPDFTEIEDFALTTGRLQMQYGVRTSAFSDGMNAAWTTAAAAISCGGAFPVREVLDSAGGGLGSRAQAPLWNAARQAARWMQRDSGLVVPRPGILVA